MLCQLLRRSTLIGQRVQLPIVAIQPTCSNQYIQPFITRVRYFCSTRPLTDGEKQITTLLKKEFSDANTIQVEDISGGCGSMYQVYIESTKFAGKPVLQQHRLVKEALKREIKEMHGIRIHTAAPAKKF